MGSSKVAPNTSETPRIETAFPPSKTTESPLRTAERTSAWAVASRLLVPPANHRTLYAPLRMATRQSPDWVTTNAGMERAANQARAASALRTAQASASWDELASGHWLHTSTWVCEYNSCVISAPLCGSFCTNRFTRLWLLSPTGSLVCEPMAAVHVMERDLPSLKG